MAKRLSPAARAALDATDWGRIDAMTDADVARQIAANPEASPDMAPEIDVRAIRRATGLSPSEFARVYAFSVRTVQAWERGAKSPRGPARTLLRAIKRDPDAVRRALALSGSGVATSPSSSISRRN